MNRGELLQHFTTDTITKGIEAQPDTLKPVTVVVEVLQAHGTSLITGLSGLDWTGRQK